ncbi:MAG: hypothetical protein IKY53_00470 [Lachnospiraceae bacterium]|nr:hypothetical protein [Lachnospiraceae bacterium]
MKKRLVICFLALAVAAAVGCTEDVSNVEQESAASDELVFTEVEGRPEEVTEEVSEETSKTEMASEAESAYRVTFEHGYEESGEFATIIVNDAEGEIWRYETSVPEVAQIDCYSILGETATSVYFLDKGVIKSFDIVTGELQWEIKDYHMSTGASLVDEDGTLYVCGYFGSFYMVISPAGEVLYHCPEAAEEDLYWPYKMEFVGEQVRIYCESNEDAIVLVNKEDYTYTVE